MTTSAPVPSRKRRFFRCMRYLLTILVALLIALLCAGAIYEGIESRRDRRQYHPPRRLVDICGHQIYLFSLSARFSREIPERRCPKPLGFMFHGHTQIPSIPLSFTFVRAAL